MTAETTQAKPTHRVPKKWKLWDGRDYDDIHGDLCLRCGIKAVLSIPRNFGGHGYRMVTSCRAWWRKPDGGYVGCDELEAK